MRLVETSEATMPCLRIQGTSYCISASLLDPHDLHARGVVVMLCGLIIADLSALCQEELMEERHLSLTLLPA